MADLTEGAIKAIQAPVQLAESLKKIATFLDVPGDCRRKLLVQANKHEFVAVPAPPRAHTVFTLADLLAYADKSGGAEIDPDDDEQEESATPLVIWHNRDGVVLVLDDGDRRDRVSFMLELSRPWRILQAIESGNDSFSQKDFIRLLRNEFAVSEAIVGEFRKINFKVLAQTSGEVARGRESLGKQIETEVKTGAAELREELLLEAPIYVNPQEDQPYRVKLLLDYDAQAGKILASVQADALSRAMDAHQATIDSRCRMGQADVAVYFGAP